MSGGIATRPEDADFGVKGYEVVVDEENERRVESVFSRGSGVSDSVSNRGISIAEGGTYKRIAVRLRVSGSVAADIPLRC